MVGPLSKGGQSGATTPRPGVSTIPEPAARQLVRRVRPIGGSASERLLGAKRVVIRPFLGPQEGLDVTETLIAAVAGELSRRYGGNETLNRLEAERLLLEAL